MPKNKPYVKRPPRTRGIQASQDPSKFVEETALAALGSGLRIAAALSTVAAKTASMTLASMATGADKFAQLVRQEAATPNGSSHEPVKNRASTARARKRRTAVRVRREAA